MTSPDGTWSFDERVINGFFLRGDLSANFFNQYSDHFFNFDFKYFNSIGNYVGQIPMDPIEGRYNFNSNFESGAERNADVEPIICRVKWDNGNCKICLLYTSRCV